MYSVQFILSESHDVETITAADLAVGLYRKARGVQKCNARNRKHGNRGMNINLSIKRNPVLKSNFKYIKPRYRQKTKRIDFARYP